MAEILKPSNLSLTWASGGDVLNPGDTKYATGWNVEIPPRQWFNYLDNRQDEAIAHINQRGIAQWDSATEYQGVKSYVQGSNGTVYRSKQTNTNQEPVADVAGAGLNWQIAFASAGDFYTKAQTDAAYLARASNLADLTNVATARTNLGVYSKAETYTKTETDGKTTVASTAQAQTGTSNTTLMTPLRTEEWGDTNVLGMGQTWQDVKSSRFAATTYTNTTGRPIQVSISIRTAMTGASSFSFLINGITVASDATSSHISDHTYCHVIPANGTYRIEASANTTLSIWTELR